MSAPAMQRPVRTLILSLVILVAFSMCASPGAAQTLYALGEYFLAAPVIDLRTIDPATGADVSTIGQVAIGGNPILAARGMAMDPVTGVMYFVQAGSWDLCTIDLTTAAATVIGSLSDNRVRDLTFDATGQLYGVTGRLGNNINSIVTIDTGTAAVSLKVAVNGIREHAIAFDPANPGTLFHRATGIFESVDIASNAITDIGYTGPAGNSAGGMVWDPISDVFLFADAEWTWFVMTPAGAATTPGAVSMTTPGLAWDRDTTVPVELASFSVD